ncbi:hypothetical protein CR513_07218, partial [Mucuna pruriens]
MDKSMIDTGSDGALMDKTLATARNLFSNMLAIGQYHISPPARVCGICASIEHSTDLCPTLQEMETNNAKVAAMMGGQQYR